MRALVLALCVVAGCAHGSRGDLAATWEQTWKTMRAQHRVALEVETAPKRIERRSMRGIIAVERPGSFRLRALGPAGLTLFDVVASGDKSAVLQAIRDPKGELFTKLLDSLKWDLVAAYALEPHYQAHQTLIDGKTAIFRAADREVRLSHFARIGTHVVPTHIEITVHAPLAYRVRIDASDIEIDVPLDPALFRW